MNFSIKVIYLLPARCRPPCFCGSPDYRCNVGLHKNGLSALPPPEYPLLNRQQFLQAQKRECIQISKQIEIILQVWDFFLSCSFLYTKHTFVFLGQSLWELLRTRMVHTFDFTKHQWQNISNALIQADHAHLKGQIVQNQVIIPKFIKMHGFSDKLVFLLQYLHGMLQCEQINPVFYTELWYMVLFKSYT